MKKNILFISFAFVLLSLNALAQVPVDLPKLLADKSICIDPGHGGHTGDDRRVEVGYEVVYWESEGNFGTGNHLYSYLEALGCDVSITRTSNEDESDISLSERIDLAEILDADYLHSIHTNAASLGSSVNYTLLLYASLNSDNREQAQFPISKSLSDIMAAELPKAVYTTSSSVYADLVFQPTWTSGYGILNGTSVPATISESAFHTNYDEARRLHGDLYQQAMAMQILKSFLKVWEKEDLNYGEVGGILTGNNGVQASNVDVEIYQGDVLVNSVKTDEFVNGYYYFPWLLEGEYELRLSYEGNLIKTENVTIEKGVHNKLDLDIDLKAEVPGLTTPSQVTFKYIKAGSDGKIKFAWNKPVPDPSGYRIYYSEDDDLQTWKLVVDEKTLNKTFISYELNVADFADVPTTSAKHFKIVAVNSMESESIEGLASKVYTYEMMDGAYNILLVDAYDRLNDINANSNHSLLSKYSNTLRKYSEVKSIVSTHSTDISNDNISMDDFDLVFWISGEESTTDESVSSDEQIKVKSYLENGGKLIISGAEIGWDLVAKGSVEDSTFYADYLKALYVSDGGKTFGPADGVEETLFEGLSVGFNGVNSWVVDWPDSFNPNEGADLLLSYQNGDDGNAAIGYKGVFGDSELDGGVIYFGFPLMSATEVNSTALIENSINYLLNITLAQSNFASISLKAYPNPVVDVMNVEGLEEGGNYEIKIFSRKGELVLSKSEKVKANKIELDLSNLSVGVYVLDISSGSNRGSLQLIKQ